VACKKRLAEVLDGMLEPIRERRLLFEKPGIVDEILRAGTAAAEAEGAETMRMVREAMKTDYLPRG
jgi:tryptophanyl-tRNA synthetase